MKTQAEYLAWIDALNKDYDRLIARYHRELEVAQENTLDELIYDTTLILYGLAVRVKQANLANRDVLVRHEPKLEFGDNKCDECRAYLLFKNDRDGLYWVTCPTRTDVTNRLDEVMETK